jgi:ribonuclease BN (tRNA processing enzyme)
MRLVLLGVRGSTPAPGAQFVRYGGHTSCVAVFGDADAVPRLILDAGTGLRDLPALLGTRPFDGAIVLTHLHWDHVQGLPFCPSIDRADAHVDLFVPTQRPSSDRGDARRLLAGAMSPPHFPIEPNGLLGQWRFLAAAPGPLTTEVTVAPIAHKGGTTFGIRIEMDGATVAYLPDHALSGRIPPRLRSSAEALAAGVDVLLHDGQFRPGESGTAVAYGHSTIDDAVLFTDRCGADALVLIHHAPGRVDAELDDLREVTSETPQGRPVTFARQGAELDVRKRSAPVAAPVSVNPSTEPKPRISSCAEAPRRADGYQLVAT